MPLLRHDFLVGSMTPALAAQIAFEALPHGHCIAILSGLRHISVVGSRRLVLKAPYIVMVQCIACCRRVALLSCRQLSCYLHHVPVLDRHTLHQGTAAFAAEVYEAHKTRTASA